MKPYAYSHLLTLAEFDKHRGEKVLEIGCGAGTDICQFAKHGAIVTAVDLTEKAVELTKQRFKVLGIKAEARVADAENLPFADNTFDLVYSFGVLHHTPNTQKTIDEIHRVLKPSGKAIIMLYNEISIEHAILIFRRLKNRKIRHLSNKSVINLLTEVNKNDKGHINPLTKLYSKKDVQEIFKNFGRVNTTVYYIRLPYLEKVLPDYFVYLLSRLFGWHLFIKAYKE